MTERGNQRARIAHADDADDARAEYGDRFVWGMGRVERAYAWDHKRGAFNYTRLGGTVLIRHMMRAPESREHNADMRTPTRTRAATMPVRTSDPWDGVRLGVVRNALTSRRDAAAVFDARKRESARRLDDALANGYAPHKCPRTPRERDDATPCECGAYYGARHMLHGADADIAEIRTQRVDAARRRTRALALPPTRTATPRERARYQWLALAYDVLDAAM